MIFCIDCFNDVEIRGEIEAINEKGKCSICQKENVFIYNSDLHKNKSAVQNMLESILRIYLPESELPDEYPDTYKKNISERLTEDWNIFAIESPQADEIIKDIVAKSLSLNDKILFEKVGIPELYDEDYLLQHSILKKHTWDGFKTSLRNVNRFHNNHFNLELLRDLLKDAVVCIDTKREFYMSATRYDELVREAKFGVKLIHKEYCSGKEIAYVVILSGLGDYRVAVNPDEMHNVHAVIDAIHQYYAETDDQRVIDGYKMGIFTLIRVAGNIRTLDSILNILFYQLEKEQEGNASFILDTEEIVQKLNSMIAERYDTYKKENPFFEPWFSRYQQSALDDYGLVLQGKPES